MAIGSSAVFNNMWDLLMPCPDMILAVERDGGKLLPLILHCLLITHGIVSGMLLLLLVFYNLNICVCT